MECPEIRLEKRILAIRIGANFTQKNFQSIAGHVDSAFAISAHFGEVSIIYCQLQLINNLFIYMFSDYKQQVQ